MAFHDDNLFDNDFTSNTELRPNTKRRCLWLDGMNVDKADMSRLGDALKNGFQLLSISIRNYHFTDSTLSDWKPLWEGIALSSSFERIHVNDCVVEDRWVEYFRIALERNTSLLELDLSSTNGIGEEAAKIFAQILRLNSKLREMKLSQCKMGQGCTSILGEGLFKNSTLQMMDLSGNEIGVEFARYLSIVLEKNTSLEFLILDRNKLGDDGAFYIALGLAHNHNLKVLSLGLNEIGNEGVSRIGDALFHNYTLRYLILCDNRIKCEGIKVLCKGVRNNSSLQKIDLSNNEIGYEGAKELCGVESLIEIDLNDNQIGDKGAEYFAELITKSTMLKMLNLSYNDIGTVGCTKIGVALEHNTALAYLCLQHRGDDDEVDYTDFCASVSNNNTLNRFDISCGIDESDRKVYLYDRILESGNYHPCDLREVLDRERILGCYFDVDDKGFYFSWKPMIGYKDKAGRLPIHVAAVRNLKWEAGTKQIMKVNYKALQVKDKETGMYPFMLAAVGRRSDLDSVYGLLRHSPTLALENL